MASKFVIEFGADQPPPPDGRLDASAFHRNSAPIRATVSRILGGLAGHAVEIGSGTGQHVTAFAGALPQLTWWPSDPNPKHRRSIEAWRQHCGLPNLMAPVELDASQADWPLGGPGFPRNQGLAGIVCINVLHIAPWAVAEGVLAAAARYLQPDGRLILYGPYSAGGVHTAPSNAAFDASLRAQDPQWGVRDIDDIARLAAANGLGIVETVAMPANNLVLVLARVPAQRMPSGN
jgi:SAM-dependent methyltransferase